MPEQDPAAEVRLPADLLRKAHFTRLAISEGAQPEDARLAAQIDNSLAIFDNTHRELQPGQTARGLMDRYLASTDQASLFGVIPTASAIYDQLAADVQHTDMVDLAALVWSFTAVGTTRELPSDLKRFEQLHDAFLIHCLSRMDPRADDGIVKLALLYKKTYEGIYPVVDELSGWYLRRAQSLVYDSVSIGNCLASTEWAHGQGFNQPLKPGDAAEIDNRAADTIEALHLLKAYGITPAIVPGESVGLPWDISVRPPLTEDDESTYTAGAIADFMLLNPNPHRTDTLLHKYTDEENKVKAITHGDEEVVLRFRLHDNGQISYGNTIHNVPCDMAEESLRLYGCENAFKRLRGLLIAIAFDLMVPDEVVAGPVVRGSTASTYLWPPDGQRRREPVIDLLLRRRRALSKAGIGPDSPHNNRPRDWPLPQQHIGGYFRPLPTGMRARPSAEDEARTYYEGQGLSFKGLPPGHTWVNAHNRGSELTEPTFHRARFRRTSATRQHLGAAGIRPVRSEKKK